MKLTDPRKDAGDAKDQHHFLYPTDSLFYRNLCSLIESKVVFWEIASILESKGAGELLKKNFLLSKLLMHKAFELTPADGVYSKDLIDLLIRCELKSAGLSAGRLLLVLMDLINLKCPFTSLKKILDFVDDQPWKDIFYHSTLLSDLLYKINEEKDLFTQDKSYTFSLLELLLDRGYSLAGIYERPKIDDDETDDEIDDTGSLYERDCKAVSKLILSRHCPVKIKKSLSIILSKQIQSKDDRAIIIEELISLINPENAARLGEILTEAASTPSVGSLILDTLRKHYRQKQDQKKLRNLLSGLIANFIYFHVPVKPGKDGPVNLSLISTFKLHQFTQYYYGEFSKALTTALESVFFPTVLIRLVVGYLNLPSLISSICAFTPPPEPEHMRYKLEVQRQEDNSSDCGAHAFTNALSGAAFITEDFNLWEAIIKDKPLQPDEKSTLFEKTRHQIIEKADGFHQGDNDTSPAVMRALIQQDSKLLKIIRDFNDTDPTLVPIDIKGGAHIGAFDALAQLQMLNNMIRIFDRLQRGLPVGGYPFLIFLQHHWITALCFGRLFLVCDSYDDNPDYLSGVCRPIQEAITCTETLKTLCKTILAQAYKEFTFFSYSEIQSPELASRQITDLFRIWLSIASNVLLRSVLEKNDAFKFKRALDLSNVLKSWEAIGHLTEQHNPLVRDLLKNSTLFSSVTGTFPTRFRIESDKQRQGVNPG